MFATSPPPRDLRNLAMSFVDATVTQLRLPYPIVRRATRRMLTLLHEHAAATDVQTLLAAVPDLAEFHQGGTSISRYHRLISGLRRMTARGRITRLTLQATGLGEHYVAFASAFAAYLKSHLGEPLTTRLIHSVPGLSAISSWPLTPHIPAREAADKPQATKNAMVGETTDPAATPPPRMP